MMNSLPQISQLIDDSCADFSSAPRCFSFNERYLPSVTAIRSFSECWPIKAFGMSASHFTFLNASASAACPHAHQIAAANHANFFMLLSQNSDSRLWRDLPRQDDGSRNDEQPQTGEGLQHSDETAAFIEPCHEADRRTCRRKSDKIAHRIGARAPFLRRVLADQGVVHRHLPER